jgi:hypothetical protein
MTELENTSIQYRKGRRKNRCWKGYRPVKGKKAYSKGSCKKTGKKKIFDKLKF